MPFGNALMIAVSGMAVVFLMLALLWVMIMFIGRAVASTEADAAPAQKTQKKRPVPVEEIAPAPAAVPAKEAPVYTAPAYTAPAPVYTAPAPVYTAPAAPADSGIYGGKIAVFDDIDDKTIACIMAIVSDETKIPLNQLIFRSIRLVQE